MTLGFDIRSLVFRWRSCGRPPGRAAPARQMRLQTIPTTVVGFPARPGCSAADAQKRATGLRRELPPSDQAGRRAVLAYPCSIARGEDGVRAAVGGPCYYHKVMQPGGLVSVITKRRDMRLSAGGRRAGRKGTLLHDGGAASPGYPNTIRPAFTTGRGSSTTGRQCPARSRC